MVFQCYYFNKYLKVQHKYNGLLIWETFSIMTTRYFYIFPILYHETTTVLFLTGEYLNKQWPIITSALDSYKTVYIYKTKGIPSMYSVCIVNCLLIFTLFPCRWHSCGHNWMSAQRKGQTQDLHLTYLKNWLVFSPVGHLNWSVLLSVNVLEWILPTRQICKLNELSLWSVHLRVKLHLKKKKWELAARRPQSSVFIL